MDNQDQTNQQYRTTPIASVEDVNRPANTNGYLLLAVVIIMAITLYTLNVYEKSHISTLNTQISNDQKTLSSSKYQTLNSQVNDIISGQQYLNSTLDSRLNWSAFYSSLNGVTPTNVSLTDVSITNAGAFMASGQAANLTSLATALVAWNKGTQSAVTPFSSVTLNGESLTTTSNGNTVVSFSVTGKVNLGALK